MKTAKQKAKSNPDQPHTNSAITPPEQNEHGLPEGWRWVKLGEVCNFIGGGTPSKKESKYWNGNVSWASVKDIKGDYLNSTEDRITNLGLKESASNIAEPGELILITRILPGRSIITNIRTAINQDLKVVKPKFQASPKFLHYYFKAFERELIKKSSGTTVLGITLNNLNEIEIPLLDIATQDKLVSKIEELLSELDKGKQQLKVYRQAVLKWAFEGKLSESMSESEFSGLQNDQKMSESELAKLMNEQNGKPSESNSVKSSHSVNSASDNLPKGWKWVKVKEVAETVGGYAFKSGDFIKEGKFQVLRMGNVRPGVLRYDESPVFINDIEEAVLTKSMLKVNDVIIIQTGTRKKRDYGFTGVCKVNCVS